MMYAGCTSHDATQGQNPCKAPIAQWIERLPPKVICLRRGQAHEAYAGMVPEKAGIGRQMYAESTSVA